MKEIREFYAVAWLLAVIRNRQVMDRLKSRFTNTIKAVKCDPKEEIQPGSMVYFKKRTWRQRLFSWPWRPWVKMGVTAK